MVQFWGNTQRGRAAKRALAALVALVAAFCLSFPAAASAHAGELAESALEAQAGTGNTYDAELTFGANGIAEDVAGSGYAIEGTTLTINAAGTYRISGSCSEGAIVVDKKLSNVTLVLDGLNLASAETAPIVVKKSSTATIHLQDGTTTTLTDNEDPANETPADEAIADAFEGAAIKVKSGATATFCGGGDLNVVANAKNGIKGGATSTLVFDQTGTVAVSGSYAGTATTAGAVNNGIAADGSLVFNQGTFDIDAANDGIKSAPDATDATEGTTVDTESAGTITINGGTFDIDVDGDGIQADTELAVSAGSFDIATLGGYSTQGTKYATNGRTGNYAFNPSTMSCKGLKAAGDRAEEVGTEPVLMVTGGTFAMNCADDALHSDGYVTVTGGSFNIDSGDDGMHADTSLTLGTENGTTARDPDVVIGHSYEGLEGGTVYMYQGRYNVSASDDGVNAAGGSSNGSDFGPGGDRFNPGGRPGGPGGMRGMSTAAASSASDYNICVYGGDLYVNCSGDGLDSNGGLYLYGGLQQVFSMSSGDNSALDADGTVSIQGATVFTGGTTGVDGQVQTSWFGDGQGYAVKSGSQPAKTVFNASVDGTVVYSAALPKAASYFMYSTPTSGAVTLSTASSVAPCLAGSQSHTWDDGVESNGIITYTCTTCGATEQRTAANWTETVCTGHARVSEASGNDGGSDAADMGYAVTFTADHARVNVYYTQNYSTPSETNVTSAVSRNGDTGAPDSTGDGQVNFTIVPDDGYTVSGVTATEGAYKNIKDVSADSSPNTYRITKITAPLAVTVAVEANESGDDAGGDGDSGSGAAGDGGDSGSGNGSDGNGSGAADDSDSNGSSDASEKNIADATVAQVADQAYTGNSITPSPAVTLGGKALVAGTDYRLDYANNCKAGVATIKVIGMGDYAGSYTTATFKIVKATGILKVTKSKKTVKASALAKAKKTVEAISVKKAIGKVAYKKKGGSKYLTVNKKTGKITVKKGTPAGTYKVKVKVTAAGSANYKAKSKTVTVAIRVK